LVVERALWKRRRRFTHGDDNCRNVDTKRCCCRIVHEIGAAVWDNVTEGHFDGQGVKEFQRYIVGCYL
jgi:hypothetical protein